jgi:D-cysteine desulfhydrase
MREIFKLYPDLKEKLPFLKIGNFPTPIHRLDKLGENLGFKNLYIKRDDLCSPLYGGNKIRKLEFLFGDAKKKNKKFLITTGCVGSNYILSVCIFAKEFGFMPTVIFYPQEMVSYIKKNLLLDHFFGCEMIYSPSLYLVPFYLLYNFLRLSLKNKESPYYLPIGGSSILGTIGYLNAVFEIKTQIEKGILPEPSYIFSALGTCGTVAGLELGVRVAKLKTKIISVQVVEKLIANEKRVAKLVNKTAKFLHNLDNSFPHLKISPKDVIVLKKYFGGKYARITREGVNAVNLLRKLENITLETTYTAKAFAGLIDFVKENSLQNETILFLNSYNSVDLSNFLINQDYKKLPKSFQKFFKLPPQELEKEINLT